jgi:hypothetical protein
LRLHIKGATPVPFEEPPYSIDSSRVNNAETARTSSNGNRLPNIRKNIPSQLDCKAENPLQTTDLTGNINEGSATYSTNASPLTVIWGFELLNQPKKPKDGGIGVHPKNAQYSIPHPLKWLRMSLGGSSLGHLSYFSEIESIRSSFEFQVIISNHGR